MFVIKAVATALSDTMCNRRNLPIDKVKETLTGQTHNVLATVRPDEWTLILVETFRKLIEVSAHLPTVGKLCNLMVALDRGKSFSFDDIASLCEKEDYVGLMEIFDHYAGMEE